MEKKKERKTNFDNFEKLWGGIFGIIAIVAAIAEMLFNGIGAESIAGAIKDIASTMVVVMVFLLAMDQLKPKNKKGFDATFSNEMDKVIEKYQPVLQKHGPEEEASVRDMLRYDIATKLDCISGKESGAYHLLFRVKKGVRSIAFSVSQTVFSDDKDGVAARIYNKVLLIHQDFIDKGETSKSGFTLYFSYELSNDADALRLAEIIDYITLLYIAEYKK